MSINIMCLSKRHTKYDLGLPVRLMHYDNTSKQYTAIFLGCKNGNC